MCIQKIKSKYLKFKEWITDKNQDVWQQIEEKQRLYGLGGRK